MKSKWGTGLAIHLIYLSNNGIQCTFKTCCIITSIFPTKYLLFHNFIFLCSNDNFFVNHALKFKYPSRYDKGQVVPGSGGQQSASPCRICGGQSDGRTGFSRVYRLSLAIAILPVRHTHSLVYRRGYIILANDSVVKHPLYRHRVTSLLAFY